MINGVDYGASEQSVHMKRGIRAAPSRRPVPSAWRAVEAEAEWLCQELDRRGVDATFVSG